MNEYLNPRETAIVVELIALARPRVVLEFGVNQGRTARAVLKAVSSIERYIGVDVPHGFRTRLACQQTEVPLRAGIFAADDPRFFLLTCDYGSDKLAAGDLEPVDAVFIDGDHSAAGVRADSNLARALLRPGGVIVWHDYNNPGVEVTSVLNSLAAAGWGICPVPDTWLAYMRNPR